MYTGVSVDHVMHHVACCQTLQGLWPMVDAIDDWTLHAIWTRTTGGRLSGIYEFRFPVWNRCLHQGSDVFVYPKTSYHFESQQG